MFVRLLLTFIVIKETLERLSDEALMLRFGEGDASAFEALLGRYEKRVFCFIRRYVLDDQTASDLLQDTFMRVIRSANRYEPSAKFSTWILRIARNLCTDFSRRKKPENVMKKTAKNEKVLDQLMTRDPNADDRIHNLEIRQRIEEAIKQLPTKQREVFVLRQMLDLSFREIASIVETSENTVKSRMRYALEALRLELQDFYHQTTPVHQGGAQ